MKCIFFISALLFPVILFSQNDNCWGRLNEFTKGLPNDNFENVKFIGDTKINCLRGKKIVFNESGMGVLIGLKITQSQITGGKDIFEFLIYQSVDGITWLENKPDSINSLFNQTLIPLDNDYDLSTDGNYFYFSFYDRYENTNWILKTFDRIHWEEVEFKDTNDNKIWPQHIVTDQNILFAKLNEKNDLRFYKKNIQKKWELYDTTKYKTGEKIFPIYIGKKVKFHAIEDFYFQNKKNLYYTSLSKKIKTPKNTAYFKKLSIGELASPKEEIDKNKTKYIVFPTSMFRSKMDTSHIYALFGKTLYRSTDGGENFHYVFPEIQEVFPVCDQGALFIVKSEGDEGLKKAIFRSNNYAKNWKIISNKISSEDKIDYSPNGNVFLANKDGVFKLKEGCGIPTTKSKIKEWLIKIFSTVVISLLVWMLRSGIMLVLARYRNTKTSKNLKPQFDFQMVSNATQYYIPTCYQNASPSRQDEPGFTHKYVSRSRMIPFFVKIAFNEKVNSERFYLVLADSGMGKTTFMINLYIKYHSFFNRSRKLKMKLFRFSNPDTLDEIKAFQKSDAKDTILLLDGLDEDSNIVSRNPNIPDSHAFKERLDEIIAATRNFCEVVITCRTQYFPGQEDDPYELKVKRPDEKGFFILNKLYISPFTMKEVKWYLNKKYGYFKIWNFRKKRRALRIVKQARHLVLRPMILSYMDFLIDEDKSFKTDYSLYSTLIEKWLLREAEKRKKISNREQFIYNLRQVSRQTALAIFDKWRDENQLYLSKEEAISIAQKNAIELRPEEITGQSLLTCDGSGNWKFAHKSILEYFLATEAVENSLSHILQNTTGMDMAKRFIEELIPSNFIPVHGGAYKMINSGNQIELDTYWISKYPVTLQEYKQLIDFYINFKGAPEEPVTLISWWDAINYCNILNEQRGFPKAYDSQGCILDSSGKRTNDIKKVGGYRLPTEAEWEYAANGGNKSKGFKYSGSNNIEEVAWSNLNSEKNIHPVGELAPNEQGLFDMSGNIWEWCYDRGNMPSSEKVRNPIGEIIDSKRAVRGGSWESSPEECSIASRKELRSQMRYDKGGFRLIYTKNIKTP